MDIAHWMQSCKGHVARDANRVYLGHETCVEQVPSLSDIQEMCGRLRDANLGMTLVTPFLVENELGRMCRLIEGISRSTDDWEVVCNDWGLLQWLSECHIAEPTIGRLLVGQASDPRLAALGLPERQLSHERDVLHADGTEVQLRYRRPTAALTSHLRSCAIAVPEVLSLVQQLGVRRIEISNTLQGVEMDLDRGWGVSLHLPEVPVAIARRSWDPREAHWLHPTFPVTLRHRDNMIFYCNNSEQVKAHPLRVDRLVYRMPV